MEHYNFYHNELKRFCVYLNSEFAFVEIANSVWKFSKFFPDKKTSIFRGHKVKNEEGAILLFEVKVVRWIKLYHYLLFS